ncbi:RHS repeat-associated core domain-containing protein [Bradyrhizobium sp. SSUT112]|uniref:RHS repeat domain-containing protein n=1 Tax=Bradyrhizobium sp. SSUT112 TaxID=3040604 RepID=UPI002448C9AD|nr:RHS repeat-associated core domain-containing protein [Bradyrhizobium sp. SSUT112]MDH2352296.1 RHS repeat-associated core domain-containing protein [Bradyrhizobium sp. SSUT112]
MSEAMQMSRPMTFTSLMTLSTRMLLAALIGLEPGLMSLAQAAHVPAAEQVVAPISPSALSVSLTPAAALSSRDAPSDPAPEGSPPLRVAADGVTAIAGRVLATVGTPLQGVTLRMGTVRTQTDEHGLYLLEGIVSGEAVLVIDGRKAREANGSEAIDHGIHETRVKAEEGRTTALPWVSWLPRIDHEHETVLGVPSTEDVVATTPSVPGLELRIPKGAVLTGIDGEAVTRVSLTAIPVNRPPFPLPRHVEVPIYFTAQPGGAVISSTDGQWLGMQVVYPNYGHELPKARGTFWRYEPDGLGWSPYGAGSVTADGQQVVPDPSTRIYALSGAMFGQGGAEAGGGGPGGGDGNGAPGPGAPFGGPTGGSGGAPAGASGGGAGPPPGGGDPVDLASGFFVQTQTDLLLGGVTPLAVTRTYRPADYNRRNFGVGTSLTYGSKLYSANQYQVVDLIMPDGGVVHYTRIVDPNNPTDNGWVTAHFTTNTPGAFYQSRIDWNGNGWNLIRTDGMLYVFGENAPMQSIQDRFGNKVTLTYSNGISGNLVQVSASNGRFIRFGYNSNNCITQAVDNIGRTVTYGYDSSSRLTTVTDPNGGVTTYTWDNANRIQSIKDAAGVTRLTNTYDTSDRVTSQLLPDGSTYTFAYSTTGGSPSGRVTTVTDPRSNVRKAVFDANRYVVSDTFAQGTPQESTWTYVRDPISHFVTSSTDPLGRRSDITYDDKGNTLSVTRLAGTASAVTTSYTYEPIFNQRTSVTDPLGHVTTYQRDILGRLTAATDANSNTTTYTSNAAGSPLTVIDALNNTTQLSYGSDGDLVSVMDPLGRSVRIYTDSIGRPVQYTGQMRTQLRLVHDPINGVLQAFDGNGDATTKTYTPVGKLASVTDPRGGQMVFAYDVLERLTTRTDAVGQVESISQRDGVGNILSSSDRKGQTTLATYDALNRPVTQAYADGTSVGLTWDLGGRLTQIQDSLAGTVTRSYDGLDRLLNETTTQGTVTYTYDAAGRRLTMQAGSQAQVTYSYDNGNRLTGITQGSSSLTFAYDAANRRTSATLPGNVTAVYSFDAASQLTGIMYSSGSTTLGTLTYGYDEAGHIVSRAGTLFQSVLPAPVSSATYDLANRLTARTAAGVTSSPTWDANGNLTNDGARSYTWDARDRLTGIIGVAGFAYDAVGRRQTATRSGTAMSFLYDGWDVVQEQQGGSPSADLVLGMGTDERFSRAGSTLLTDALGSTLALVSSAGAIQTSYGYDAYGSVQIAGVASDNPFQFTGRENDSTGIYYYRNRYYSPAWGRFVSEDPIGLAGGDVNLYRYVGNNPLGATDPSGNVAIAIPIGIGLAELIKLGLIAGGTAGTAYGLCYLFTGCGPTPSSTKQTPPPNTVYNNADESGSGGGSASANSNQPTPGNLKQASQADLQKAAQADGYNRVENWKTQELQLNSKDQILVDRQGNLYSVPRQGGGDPQPLNIRVPR